MSTTTAQGAEIWWEEDGQGEPVLLIQGLGYPGDMWYRLVPALSSRYRTLRFDNRGTGRTGVPPGPYTVEMMAADAIAVLDAAGAQRAHVVGVSMGGVIAQEVALTYPARVRSLVLGCTHPGGQHSAPFDPDALAMVAARSTMSPRDAAEAAIPFVYAPTTPRARIDEDFAVRMRIPTTPEGYTNQAVGSSQYGGSYARLGSIDVPTLVVHGTQDRLVNPANAPILSRAIPGARLKWLEGASHVFFTDQPERTAALLLTFLDSCVQPAIRS